MLAALEGAGLSVAAVRAQLPPLGPTLYVHPLESAPQIDGYAGEAQQVIVSGFAFVPALLTAVAGYVAPWSIQLRRASTSFAESLGPSGGILNSASFDVTRWISSLPAALPVAEQRRI